MPVTPLGGNNDLGRAPQKNGYKSIVSWEFCRAFEEHLRWSDILELYIVGFSPI
jgi:hypothetical protein